LCHSDRVVVDRALVSRFYSAHYRTNSEVNYRPLKDLSVGQCLTEGIVKPIALGNGLEKNT